MAIDVIMPQMGESIAEGTIVKWIKKVGEEVKRDEPLFEISTDKVDAEIPSPSAGVLVEILATEGQTVPINTVVARIDAVGSKPVAAPAPKVEEPKPAPPVAPPPAPVAPPPVAAPVAQPTPVAQPAPVVPPPVAPPPVVSQPVEAVEKRSSPLVRKIARENSVNINELDGTGLAGRVTKNDILSHIANKETVRVPVAVLPTEPVTPPPVAAPVVAAPVAAPVAQPSLVIPPVVTPVMETYRPGDRVEIVAMSPMRKKISEHMVASRRISAHVQSFFEIDMTKIAKLREQHKDKFLERHGVKLTFTPFIMKAVVDALGAWPILNASVDGDNIVYKKDINLGIAVALDWGLIVPVVKNAEEKNLVGLTRAMNDLATRARKKQLKPDEVQGGTFTITNPGVFGSLFGTPIINQPQVAIMGVGTIEKRLSVMEDDSIAIRTKAYFSISFDHRVVDGAVADQFMSHVKRVLENFDASAIG